MTTRQYACLLSIFFTSLLAVAKEKPPSCPQFAGEYVSYRCPAEKAPFVTMRIIQPNCTALGYATIKYTPEGVPSQLNPTTWDVIGAGKMHHAEISRNVEYIERVYANNSLFRYTYTIDKETNKVTQIIAGALSILDNNNLLSTYFGSGATLINVNNCKSTKIFFNIEK
ncbi:MAG: hypothetical protein IPM97_15380 [Bdellovibrionaceae bacterium]|nr:hypothetical protein [Pseudobdellovibrionaceae bacterium]